MVLTYLIIVLLINRLFGSMSATFNDRCYLYQAKNLLGDYDGRGVLGFNTLTLVPNQRECIDAKLLDDFEVKRIIIT